MNLINKIAFKISNLWFNFIVLTLLFRYFNLCSSYTIFHEELEKFKSIMIQIGYPIKFLDNCLRKFLDKFFCLASTTTSVPKRILLFTLPFTRQHSFQIRKQVVKLFSSAFPQIQVRVIFKTIRHLFSFFPF